MKKRLITIIVIIGVLILAVGAAVSEMAQGSWSIGERKVPAPAAASDTLRNSIINTPTPNVAAFRQSFPKDNKALEAWLAKVNTPRAESVANIARQLSISIKREEIAGVTVWHVMPENVDSRHRNHPFIHIHGGGYIANAGIAGIPEALVIAETAKIPVLSIDYRMPPAHPFPAALKDVVSVYKRLLADRPAKSMAIGGSSAGGGLTLASTLRFIQLGLEVPGALFTGTPWADLTKTGDSFFTLEGLDRMLVTYDGFWQEAAKLYAAGRDLKEPLISPLYGDFHGFPPTYLVTGTRDLLLSDTVRTHRKLRNAGVIADLNVYEGMAHVDYLIVFDSPEAQKIFEELNAFLLTHLK